MSRGFDEVVLLNEQAGGGGMYVSQYIRDVWERRCLRRRSNRDACPASRARLLLKEIRVDGIAVSERKLTLADLADADEVFVTSSTGT